MTDQSLNMKGQLVSFVEMKKFLPGIQWFTDARDRLIKFHGNGSVAIASFYWYRSFVLPADMPMEKRKLFSSGVPPATVTLVMEKKDGDWKIVHTQYSRLNPQN